ncbi:MAG: glutamate--tRNA ligase [bacterium]|nr:glutamate--tRNA ligase [bacterium]
MMSEISREKNIRVRIAPSPTGKLHIGTARTALFNYLFAKRTKNGKFILRIEDTDLERSDPAFEKDILENLRWLGIIWDEGPDIGGPHAPYRQSERTVSYRKYLQKLLDEDRAYWCFCSEEELKSERERAREEGGAPRYSGKCRAIPLGDAAKRIESGERAIIRFKTPPNKKIAFEDIIRDKVEFDTANMDDFSIGKAVDVPLYNFAVVIDDFEMEISHVIRGEDHISNTPKQILLIEALGFPTVQYAHLPLILGPDRSKMSKRHGGVLVAEYREQGYLPEAMFNFMAMLGWNPNTNEENLSQKELIDKFSLGDVQKAGAIFNQEKLDWMNGKYIRLLFGDRGPLLEKVRPYIQKAGHGNAFEAYGEERQRGMLLLANERMKKLSDIVELSDFFFEEPVFEKELLRWKTMSDADIASSLEKTAGWLEEIPERDFSGSGEALDVLLKEKTKDLKDKGSIFWPLRVSLTGKKASPPPAPIMAILGKEKTLERLRGVIAIFS